MRVLRGKRVERGMAADGDRSKGNKVEARKESRAARGPRLKGEREQLALPKAIKVWFTHSLNKSTYHPSLPFFQVCGFHRSAPTPTVPSALSFPPTLTWQNCEFHNETRASCRPPWTVCFYFIFLHLLYVGVFKFVSWMQRLKKQLSLFFFSLAMLARWHPINLSRASFGIMQIPKWFLFLRPLSSLCPPTPLSRPPPPSPFLTVASFSLIELYSHSNLLKSVLAVTSTVQVAGWGVFMEWYIVGNIDRRCGERNEWILVMAACVQSTVYKFGLSLIHRNAVSNILYITCFCKVKKKNLSPSLLPCPFHRSNIWILSEYVRSVSY